MEGTKEDARTPLRPSPPPPTPTSLLPPAGGLEHHRSDVSSCIGLNLSHSQATRGCLRAGRAVSSPGCPAGPPHCPRRTPCHRPRTASTSSSLQLHKDENSSTIHHGPPENHHLIPRVHRWTVASRQTPQGIHRAIVCSEISCRMCLSMSCIC